MLDFMENEISTETLIKYRNREYKVQFLKDYKLNTTPIVASYLNRTISYRSFVSKMKVYNEELREGFIKEFGLDIRPRFSNFFAVAIMFRPDVDVFKNLEKALDTVRTTDLYKVINESKRFFNWLDNNMLEIDMEEPKVLNLPKTFYFPLYLSIDMDYLKITPDEFTAIILHELGHIFTKLEFYNRTTFYTIRLMDALLENNMDKVYKTLGITANEDLANGAKTDIVRLITKFFKETKPWNLAAVEDAGKHDVEYEADAFVTRFGYGDKLVTALNKLMAADKGSIFLDFFLIFVLRVMFVSFIASVIFFSSPNTALAARITTIVVVLLTIDNIVRYLIENIKSRMGSTGSHGSLEDRIRTLKKELIRILRVQNKTLTTEEKKNIIESLNTIDKELEKVKKSSYSKIVMVLVDHTRGPNMNIEERLTVVINKLINNEFYINKTKLELLNSK